MRLLVVGETAKDANRIVYPRNPERRPLRDDWWDDAPEREMGGHDGLPDALRARRATARRLTGTGACRACASRLARVACRSRVG